MTLRKIKFELTDDAAEFNVGQKLEIQAVHRGEEPYLLIESDADKFLIQVEAKSSQTD